MVLDAFGKVQYPTVKQEQKLYGIYRCMAFKGTLASAIGECLSKNRLNVSIYHSSSAYLDNRDGYYPESLYHEILEEYKQKIDRIMGSVSVSTDFCFSHDWYRNQLDNGNLLIVQCLVPGNADGMHDHTLHWILLYGYTEEEYLVCNPSFRKIRLSESELEYYTDTPVGSICVAVHA